MKTYIFTFLIIMICIGGKAQTQLNADFFSFENDLKSEIQKYPEGKAVLSCDILGKYAINLFDGVYYVSFLGQKNQSFNSAQLKQKGIRIGSEIGDFVTLRVPISMISSNFSLDGIGYLELARKLNPNLNKATKDTRVDSVHQGFTLPKAFTGKDVIIGITDWGFDYTNPNFYDTNKTQTRIIAAWDQYRKGGPQLYGYDYGSFINGTAALLQTQCDTFNIYEWATHGSHVAGIAGGSGFTTPYRGVAFESQYLMATILPDEAAVIDAFNWMKIYSNAVSKRLVVNMSWGLYWMGNLDGSALVNQIIDQLSAQNIVFVSSAGNNGDEQLHIKKQFTSSSDTLKTVIGFNSYASYPNMWGQSVSAWGQANKQFSVALQVLNSSNQVMNQSIFYNTANATNYVNDTLIVGADTILFNIAIESSNPQNQRPHMRLRVRSLNSAYKIALLSTANSNCVVHYWNVIELINDVGNWGGPFLAPNTNYTAGDAFYSIGDPASTKSVITVAAHSSDTWAGNGTLYPGAIAAFSSWGPTLDERMKPDISAPGVSVASSISSFTNQSMTGYTIVASDTFQGRTYKFVRFSGTSMSGPMVTGIVALMLEANPYLSPAQIKYILQKTAREDIKTGNIPDTGSTRWGYGKVNALAAIKLALQTTNSQNVTEEIPFLLYPNPTNDKVWILSDESSPLLQVDVFQIDGKKVFESKIQSNEAIDVSALKSGIYLIKINDGKQLRKLKFVKD